MLAGAIQTSQITIIRLPNLHPQAVWLPHVISLCHIESRIELLHILERSCSPIHSRAMWISQDLPTQAFITVFGSPDGGPAQEETLFLCKAIDRLRFLMVVKMDLQTIIGSI